MNSAYLLKPKTPTYFSADLGWSDEIIRSNKDKS